MSEPTFPTAPALDRRSLLKVLALGAAATAPLGGRGQALAQQQQPSAAPVPGDPALPAARGTESDPSLVMPARTPWPLVLTAPELETATALADTILPADEKSPAASAAGVPAFLNEWVSAPYPVQKKDLETVRGGLAWLNTESFNRFGTHYAKLSEEQKTAICDDIHHLPKARPEHLTGARFFAAFRDLCASGYYTTAIGFEDLGYIGNRPSPVYEGAPKEVLAKLGL